MLKRKLASLFFVFTLLVGVPVLAQEVELTPEPDPVSVVVEGDADVLFDEVEAPPVVEPDIELSFFMEGALTLAIVAVLKKLKPLDGIPAVYLQTGVAIVLWLAFLAARSAGFADQFNNVSNSLTIALPAIVELVLSLVGSTLAFRGMKAASFPLLGASRT